MKKVFLTLAVVAVAALGMTSCSDEARCWKVTTSSDKGEITTYVWGTKSDMQAAKENAEKVIMNLYEDLSKIDEPLQTFNLTQNGQYQFMTTYDKVSIFNLFSSTPITFSLIFSNIEAIIPITRNVSEYILPKKKGFYYFQFERYFFEESVFSVNDYYSLEFVDLETEKRSYCFYFPCILDTLILTNRSYKLILESRDEEEERIMVYSQNLQKFSDIKENETITVTDEWKIKQLLYYKLDISNYQVGYENLMKFVELNYRRDNVFVSFHCSVVSANDTSYSGIVSNYKEGNNCKNVTDLFYPFDDGYSYFSFSKTKEEQNVFVIVIDIITYYKQYFSFFISPMIALDGSKDVIINIKIVSAKAMKRAREQKDMIEVLLDKLTEDKNTTDESDK